MKLSHTYRSKHGIYYYRQVLTHMGKRVDVRFSLQTRDVFEARMRAYSAWLSVNAIILNGGLDATAIRTKIQSSKFNGGVHLMDDFSPPTNIPDLVTLSSHIESDDITTIKNAIIRVANNGGRIFVPYSRSNSISGSTDHRCSIYPIFRYDPDYEDEPEDNSPLDVETVHDDYVVLTEESVKAAKGEEAANSDRFIVKEFFSYDYSNNWTKKEGFSLRFFPSPFETRYVEVLVTREDTEKLWFPKKSVSNPVSLKKEKKCGKISDELEKYCNDKMDKLHWTEKTKQDNESIFNTFVEIIGDKPVEDITSDDVVKYSKLLNYLPPNREKNPIYANQSVKEAIDGFKVRGGDAISITTKNKYISRLSGPFKKFMIYGWIPYNFISTIEGYKIPIGESVNERDPFTSKDLKKMFEGEKSIKLISAKAIHPSRAWGLLIALFTGARAEEIFSLLHENVVFDDGIPYFDIKVTKGHNTLKNKASIRKIPIHPKLLELGFERFVKMSKAVQKGNEISLLFPDLKKSPKHGWRCNPTRWVNGQFLTKLEIKSKTKVFHSFRHVVADQFKNADGIDVYKASYYLGQCLKGAPLWVTNYGKNFDAKVLLEITDKIDYDINFTQFKKKCLDNIKQRQLKSIVKKRK